MKGKLKSIGAVADMIIDKGHDYTMSYVMAGGEVEYIIENDDYSLVPAMCVKFGTTIEIEPFDDYSYFNADGYRWHKDLFEKIYDEEEDEDDDDTLDKIESEISTILTRLTYHEKKLNAILEALEGDYED